MVAFLSIALYNVIETTLLVFAVFKQRKGLYFWSFIIANWGIVPHGVGFILKFFRITTMDLLSSAIIGVGWACMVIGQSVVLYSRLHLVVRDQTRIRWVLYMIIFNGIIIGIPLFVLAMGANSKHTANFLPGFLIYDKVQLVVISVQETIISLIYIYETIRLLGQGNGKRQAPVDKLLRHLILVNIVVLIFDITLLAVQFSGHYQIQTTYKTAVYSIKLKLEFSVLNRLVSLVRHKDLLSSPNTPSDNTMGLSRWTAGNAVQGSSNCEESAVVSRIEKSGRWGESGKEAAATTTEIHISQAETLRTGNGSFYSQTPDSQSNSLHEARHPSNIL
ncbi:integral membrane protein [Paraphoma chrysanthemicola]|uniref:Integral membrane protein n=1 Tax=Paraphoma chrysanthemicola TaxID=798071 RepID=A0A8K0QTC2_9PLEO|nr:integral membrane protein [Paraphoma chrysanthemicola]